MKTYDEMTDRELLLAMVRRMDSMDQRMESMDQRMGSMDQRMDSLDQRMDAIESKVDSVDQRLNSVEMKVDGLEIRLNNVDQKLDGLETKMERYFNETVKAVGDVVDIVGKQIKDSEERLSARIEEIEVVTAQNCYEIQKMKNKRAM